MNFILRPMVESDLAVTLEWRNEAEVLRNAMTPHIVSEAEHNAMFMYNNAIKLLFEIDSISAGFVSFTREPDELIGEWAFHLAKEFRGKGLSEIMLKCALYYIKTEEGYTGIKSTVLKHNHISQHLHDKLGFEQTENNNNTLEYWLSL